MNILFLTLVKINSLRERGIYQDLLRKFTLEGHHVVIATPAERREKVETNLRKENNVEILKIKTFNIQKANLFEKGIGILSIEYQYLTAIKKYLSNYRFDLILYSTPPITFFKIISYIKKRDNAYCYLLLKDIFPQNAVDMKMILDGGLLHRYFLRKEKKMYQISDTIGCMSPANANFLLKHNQDIMPKKVEVNPNSIEPHNVSYTNDERATVREKYRIPIDKTIFVYGGNLGIPQGIQFLIDTICNCTNKQVFFLIVGNGTEYAKIDNFFRNEKPINAMLIQSLPKSEYNQLLASCDAGLIFLDKNFTIPNFPSRLLSYLEMKMPVIAATDPNTDIGDIIQKAGCGYKVLAGDIRAMMESIDKMIENNDLIGMGEMGWELLQESYLVEYSYQLILKKIKRRSSLYQSG